MEFLKNIIVNLKVTGPAAVLIAWVIDVVILGLFGKGEIASRAMGILAGAGGVLCVVHGMRT
ncbi:MAG: hypothetical protein KGK03_07755 [Candidatus Omnitrophica bacterium]|nr:hypothetical protein [Candidatus Omnitrophota bacterium]